MHGTKSSLSSYWGRIKDFLFSPIEEEVGSLTNKQQQLITALEVIRIEDFIERHAGVGRPPEDRLPIARAFIAKAVYGHTTTRQLLDQLQSDIEHHNMKFFAQIFRVLRLLLPNFKNDFHGGGD